IRRPRFINAPEIGYQSKEPLPMPKLIFLPSNKTGIIECGKTILDAARSAGVSLPVRCGGKGTCGKCRVRIVEGDYKGGLGKEEALTKAEIASGWRLACCTTVNGDLVVEVPEQPVGGVMLTDFGETTVSLNPQIKAVTATVPAASLADQSSDLKRLSRAIGQEISPSTPIEITRLLPKLLRETATVTAVLWGEELIDIIPHGKQDKDFKPAVLGLAVDVGTTTVAGVLLDLLSGDDLATASRPNPQATHGDDVLSRIAYASRGEDELQEMQRLITTAIDEIASETTGVAGVKAENIYEIVAAGNTTMHHLLLGINPQSIGVIPFVPAKRGALSVCASEIGMQQSAPCGRLYAAANVSGYIGGDITVGLLAHRIHEDDRKLLYIDIGTNGEVVLRAGAITYGCSTAAGPAFEGARISRGMCATTGAVNYVKADLDGGDLIIQTINAAPIEGICGTGLIDAVAALLELGVLDETGRLLNAGELPANLPEAIRQRLDYSESAPRFILSSPGGNQDDKVALTARDIREMQLAKGAIAAGITTLLETAGIQPQDLDEVMLAGAFGSFLRPESARRVGLLPSGIASEKIRSIGNAALAGARAILLNREERASSEALAREVKYIELSSHPGFQDAFVEAMQFPGS
ncbi:MAG: DUF4445 domain-containing protein, partial [Planctomycetes bacterium]|nr:DUF4445 domain-containing protein [Planctomycetota bacterium]